VTGGGVVTGGGIVTVWIVTQGGVAMGRIATGGFATGGIVTGGGVTTGGIVTGGGVATGGIVTGGVATGGMLMRCDASPMGVTVDVTPGVDEFPGLSVADTAVAANTGNLELVTGGSFIRSERSCWGFGGLGTDEDIGTRVGGKWGTKDCWVCSNRFKESPYLGPNISVPALATSS
jgi:hypothetical protein